jgi:hypothetical protein
VFEPRAERQAPALSLGVSPLDLVFIMLARDPAPDEVDDAGGGTSPSESIDSPDAISSIASTGSPIQRRQPKQPGRYIFSHSQLDRRFLSPKRRPAGEDVCSGT